MDYCFPRKSAPLRHDLWHLFVLGCLSIALTGRVVVAGERYVAVWQDGSQSEADELLDWGKSDSRPTIGGRRLFDPTNPVRTIRDTKLARGAVAETYIELRGGDRLPGRVVQFVPADVVGPMPAHFLVEPTIDLGFPKVFRREQVRVLADWVSAIVQRPTAGVSLRPRSLRLLSGEVESFRAIRWQPQGGQVLGESGPKVFSFAQIGALQIDSGRLWSDWQRQLALVSPGIDSPIVFLELTGGARVTTSLERFKPRTQGGDEPSHWFFLVQPVWSLDLLAVPHRQILRRTFLPANQTPLTAIRPSASRHHSILSSAWFIPRFNHGLHGTALRAGGREHAWGIGVAAPHDLEFELPPSAQAVRTQVAIDPAADDDGCARARLEFAEKTLWQSPAIVGAGAALDSGRLLLGQDSRRHSRLVLAADAAVRDRPTGADPLDIRDFLNWLEPVIEHDPAVLAGEVRAHFADSPWLAEWIVDPAKSSDWRLTNHYDETDGAAPCFRHLIRLYGPLTLTRRIETTADRQTLEFHFGQPGEGAGQWQLEILIDGQSEVTRMIASREPSSRPLEIAVPLHGPAGRTIECRLNLDPVTRSAVVDWRGMTLAH